MIAYMDSDFKKIANRKQVHLNGWRKGKLPWLRRSPKRDYPHQLQTDMLFIYGAENFDCKDENSINRLYVAEYLQKNIKDAVLDKCRKGQMLYRTRRINVLSMISKKLKHGGKM